MTSACKAFTTKGKPCATHAMPGSEYCLFHDPARAADRAKVRSDGGKARHGRKIGQTGGDPPSESFAPVSVRSLDDVLIVLEQAINDQRRLENSSTRNRTIATLATAAMECLKVGELEQRIAALEQLVNADNRTPLQRLAADELAQRQALRQQGLMQKGA